MTDVFFHLGLHKTGTTFLQKRIFKPHPSIKYIRKPLINMKLSSQKKNVISFEGLSGNPYQEYTEKIIVLLFYKGLRKFFLKHE